MTTIYHLITEKYKEREDSEQLFEKLNGVTANEYGAGIFCDLRDSMEFSLYDKLSILKYIAYAYTLGSEYVVYGASSINQKVGIAAMVGMPENLHKAVLHLGSPVVRTLIDNYLEFQKDRDYKHLENKKHTYESLQRASINDVKNENGDTNYKLVVEIQNLSDRLLNEIMDLEDKLSQRYGFIIKNKDEIKKAGGTGAPPATLKIEASPFIGE